MFDKKKWIARILHYIFSFRYDVKIIGEEHLSQVLKEARNKRGIVALSNHSSFLDGILFGSYFVLNHERDTTGHSIIVDKYYPRSKTNTLFYHILKYCDTLSIPEFRYRKDLKKTDDLDNFYAEFLNGLDEKDFFLLFPSGAVKHQAKDELNGQSALQKILEERPDTELLFVRISGLWGSIFTGGYTGKVPHFMDALMQGVKIALKNGIFFIPKRKVTIEFARKKLSAKNSRTHNNQILEDWWCAPYPNKEEPRILVPHYFYQKVSDAPTHLPSHKHKKADDAALKTVIDHISKILKIPSKSIQATSRLGKDLSLDSLEIIQLICALDPDNKLGNFDIMKFDTVEDLAQAFKS